MDKYPKIQTIFRRDPDNNYKTLLIGEWALPEFEYLSLNDWVWTEKVDGTNIRVGWNPDADIGPVYLFGPTGPVGPARPLSGDMMEYVTVWKGCPELEKYSGKVWCDFCNRVKREEGSVMAHRGKGWNRYKVLICAQCMAKLRRIRKLRSRC